MSKKRVDVKYNYIVKEAPYETCFKIDNKDYLIPSLFCSIDYTNNIVTIPEWICLAKGLEMYIC